MSHFLKMPVYFSSLVLGKCAYDEGAMKRALFDRTCMLQGLPHGYVVNKLRLLQGDTEFEHSNERMKELRKQRKEENVKLTASPSGNSDMLRLPI